MAPNNTGKEKKSSLCGTGTEERAVLGTTHPCASHRRKATYSLQSSRCVAIAASAVAVALRRGLERKNGAASALIGGLEMEKAETHICPRSEGRGKKKGRGVLLFLPFCLWGAKSEREEKGLCEYSIRSPAWRGIEDVSVKSSSRFHNDIYITVSVAIKRSVDEKTPRYLVLVAEPRRN